MLERIIFVFNCDELLETYRQVTLNPSLCLDSYLEYCIRFHLHKYGFATDIRYFDTHDRFEQYNSFMHLIDVQLAKPLSSVLTSREYVVDNICSGRVNGSNWYDKNNDIIIYLVPAEEGDYKYCYDEDLAISNTIQKG